jgi:DNA invertase Pin-like site-specific DNA recombinase
MLIGYIRVSKSDGTQPLDLQRGVLQAAGVATDRIYEDLASGAAARMTGRGWWRA